MTIRKAQANYDNGSSYEVLHYETQSSQVKIIDKFGETVSDLNEMLFDGKPLDGISVNTVTGTGKYRIKNGVNLPSGVATSNTFILTVESVDVGDGVIVSHQKLYDHINNETYHRTINGASIGSWVKLGKTVADQVSRIGDLATLTTSQKSTIVGSINSVASDLNTVKTVDIVKIKSDISNLRSDFENHNHDTKYLSLSGGSLTGTTSVANNSSFAGKNTSGNDVNLAKVTGTNNIDIGDPTLQLSLHAKDGVAKVYDGTSTTRIFHSGHMGAGSGLDADKIDGIQGSQLARRDAINDFTADQGIHAGKSLFIKAESGSSQAGSLFFQDGSGNQKARIKPMTDGTLQLHAGTTVGLEVHPSGDTETTHDHILNAKDRQVAVRFKLSDSDKGAGFYMNNTTKQVGFYDWDRGGVIFRTDRDDQTVKFENEIYIQGHKLSIQSSAPSSPRSGDIWIDI
ncbi:pyocin knob domain-containing protein [Bacillus subtilis]|uniref:pyocin knob domain-containing protein n=1 Tax=Bacillus subtilis TaxID=1423 RepID=UPI003CF7F77D